MKWSNTDGAAARRVPMIGGLLVGMLALGWGSWAQAEIPGVIGGPDVGPSATAVGAPGEDRNAKAEGVTTGSEPGYDDGDAAAERALPFKATVLIIELTDDDIELQVFVDGNNWKRLSIAAPNDKLPPGSRGSAGPTVPPPVGRQGMSELMFASEPTPFPLDASGEIDPVAAIETVKAFLDRFPVGEYEFKASTPYGDLRGKATLTHVLPALPEIVKPISLTDDPPVVDPKSLVIEWKPVTARFIGDGPVEIIEYHVILDQVTPPRATPWIDGSSRRALINLPASATSLTIPPEFFLPNTLYDFEVVAIEASGNSTISSGEFMTK